MIPSSATCAKANPSTRTQSSPAACATASASWFAPARIWMPHGSPLAALTAIASTVIAAVISGPTPPRRYGTSCMFSSITPCTPAAR